MRQHGSHSQFHRAAIVPTGVLLGGKAYIADGRTGMYGAIGYGFPNHYLPGEWLSPGLGADRGGSDKYFTIFVGVHVISFGC